MKEHKWAHKTNRLLRRIWASIECTHSQGHRSVQEKLQIVRQTLQASKAVIARRYGVSANQCFSGPVFIFRGRPGDRRNPDRLPSVEQNLDRGAPR
jgi:hypothetical protein